MPLMGFGQETIKYQGILKGYLLTETFELYPDKTFKWTSNYDLKWNEQGKYKLLENRLELDFYSELNGKVIKTEHFNIENNKMYRLPKKKRRKEKSIKTKWSWLFGHKFKYEIRKNANKS